MTKKLFLAAATVVLAAGLPGLPARADATNVKVGFLTCDVGNGWGFVFGSTRDLKCTFTSNSGATERYTGHINKFGVDIGYVQGGVMAWAVFAPTAHPLGGALAGTYAGVTAGAAAGVGGNANVLVGGSGRTVSLQPVSIEGTAGLNVAAGLAELRLRKAAG